MIEKFTEQGRKAAEQGMAMSQEFMKKFGGSQTTAMPDAQGLIEAHKRNLEAITAANKVALEGAQAVARRHVEILQQATAEMAATIKELSAPEAPQAKAAKQTDLVKTAYEHAIANMRELRDLMAHSNSEAVELLNKRFLESLDEIKNLVEKGK
jgi:phasin family protein